MLKDKKASEQHLDRQCDRIVVDNDKCKSIYSYANETYNIPKGIILDLISKRMAMSEASEFVLFILLDSINNVLKKDKENLEVDKFYTMQEAQYYRKSKYEIGDIKFPLVFKMIKVEEDQWTGRIDVKTLMRLRQAQLINYNINAQRTMQKIVRGEKESYKITLNKKAVEEIASEFSHNTFIPNTITLNIPAEIDSDFFYDEDTCSLVIKSLDHYATEYRDYVCVDGLQRITAAQRFVHNEIKVFGSYFKEFEDSVRTLQQTMILNVNDLKTEKEVLQWYVDMNAGGTPHTNEEIERVKKMIAELE